jgi:hypothetical protein
MNHDYEKQGTGYDAGAAGHELQGRESAPKTTKPRAPRKHIKQPGVGKGGWTRTGERMDTLNVRLPASVRDYYDNGHRSVAANMREVLTKHMLSRPAEEEKYWSAVMTAMVAGEEKRCEEAEEGEEA